MKTYYYYNVTKVNDEYSLEVGEGRRGVEVFHTIEEATKAGEQKLNDRIESQKARDNYKMQTQISVIEKNESKSDWKFKLQGKNGHYLPIVLLDESGKVVGTSINPVKARYRASELSTDQNSVLPYWAKDGTKLA